MFSEIGALKKVCVHRPGMHLVNMKAEDFDRVDSRRVLIWTMPRKSNYQFTGFAARWRRGRSI